MPTKVKCPACDSDRVYQSRARTFRDRVTKRLLPVRFYRCHECGWRRARVRKMTVKEVALHTLSVIGYIGTLGLAAAILAGIVFFGLTFLGIPMPWSR